MMFRPWLIHPFTVALIVTGLNAVKPVCVDDTAYLLYARHISTNLTEPYGFSIFWNQSPEPAMDVLCPLVLPYWLAFGRLCLGTTEHHLKIWLFPITLLLTFSVRSLARSWSLDERIVPLVAYSGFILPLFGFMLDVPAIAFGIGALSRIVRGGLARAALAGLLLAIAFQTKYTMMTMPAIVAAYCLLHRKWLELIVSMSVAGALVNGWEWLMIRQHGQSHFWHHLTTKSIAKNWAEVVLQKWGLLLPLVRHGGFLLIGPALVASQAAFGRSWIAPLFAAIGIITFCGVTFLPDPWGMRFARVGFHLLGAFVLLAMLQTAHRLWRSGNSLDRFLVIWMVIELLAYFALSPFPAGRRLVSLGSAFAFASFRVSRLHLQKLQFTKVWLIGPLLGFGLFVLDAYDARAEKECAEQVVKVSSLQSGRIWHFGQWGLEYYLNRDWFQQFELSNFKKYSQLSEKINPPPIGSNREFVFPDADPNEDNPNDAEHKKWEWNEFRFAKWILGRSFCCFKENDLFVVTDHVSQSALPRLPSPQDDLIMRHNNLHREFVVTCDDSIPGGTIPTLYGESYPIRTRTGPRLKIVIYRVTQSHFPERRP